MFMLIGGAEKAGSGIDRIRKGWESQHWRYPMVRLHMNPDRVNWRLPMVSLIPEESLNRLQRMFGEATVSALEKEEVLALVTADTEKSVDNLRMRQITGKHAADITQLLQGLVSRNLLEQEGHGRWTKYRLPRSVHKDPSSVHNDTSSIHNDTSSIHKDPSSIHKDSSSIHKAFCRSDITETELLHLQEVAAVVRGRKRTSPEEMEKTILTLCTERFLTRRQLSALLNRNAASLLSRFLTPMVRHKVLLLKYPETPNREDQAYTTAR